MSEALALSRRDERAFAPTEAAAPARDISAAIRGLRDGGHDAIVAAARAAAQVVAAHADHYDRAGGYPFKSFDALWEAGLTSLTLPVELGGVGASVLATAHAVQTVAAADGSTAFLLKAHLASLRGGVRHWPEAARTAFLGSLLDGPAHQAGSRSDAKGGSPVRGGTPDAIAHAIVTEEGERGWRLNAHKRFATASIGADWISVWAATAPEDGETRVGMFLIPADAPGLTVVEGSWDQIGMRATVSNDLLLKDVVIPFDHALGLTPFHGVDPASADRTRAATATVDLTSILEAAVYAGLAVGARDWLLGYLHERRLSGMGGASLATAPRFQEAVGEIDLLIWNSQLVIDDVAARLDRQTADPASLASPVTAIDTGLARENVVRNAHAAIDKALVLVGNAGLAYRNPIQRHFRDVLCGRVHEPKADILFTARGRQVLESFSGDAGR